MKKIFLAAVAFLAVQFADAQTKKIDVKRSSIEWVGKKVTGAHNGTIAFESGSLTFKNGKLTGGSFVVDMTSITVLDLKAGSGKEKLEGHLKADDFFGVDKHKKSTLVFKTIKETGKNLYDVTADLTIKGITKQVSFSFSAEAQMARTVFNVDRTKYDIKYNSGSFFSNLGDKMINDEFELAVGLFF